MKVRVIPIILLRNFGVVKTVEFSVYRPLGVATNFARVYNSRGVDELIVLDIDATQENRGPDLEYVRDISEECKLGIPQKKTLRTLLKWQVTIWSL
ncbi:MAG: hypothetical protein EB078_01105 [Proteobacteria bacterium]|nr:hypothetical protein [Pseudomonadota bacterium]